MKKIMLLLISISMITIIAACGSNDDAAKNKDKQKETGEQTAQKVEVTDKEKLGSDKVVLTVNKTEVKGEQYNALYAQTKSMMGQYGQDVKDTDKVKEKTMDVLIQQELIKQDAAKSDISVPAKKIQNAFDKIKKENGDKLKTIMDQYELSESEYKKQLEFELILDEYLKKEIKTPKVSDDQIKAYYDKIKDKTDEVPKYKEIKEQLKGQLEQQNQQQELQKRLDKLKKEAKVKQLI